MSGGTTVTVGSNGCGVITVATPGPPGPPGAAGSASFTQPVTVANLPNPPVAGSHAMVTDATSSTFYSTVVGGGSLTVPVFADGFYWRVG